MSEPASEPPPRLTIKPWAVYRAWLPADQNPVQRWALCHRGSPILAFETPEEARAQVLAWGWDVDDAADETVDAV